MVDPAVAQWIRLVCRPTQWLELRFVAGRGRCCAASSRAAAAEPWSRCATPNSSPSPKWTSTIPHALVPVLSAGLSQQPPARFDEFSLPARVGARADEQIRNGAPLREVLDFLGIPASARPVVEAAFAGRRNYVEIVAGQHRDGHRVSTDVGVSIVDTQLAGSWSARRRRSTGSGCRHSPRAPRSRSPPPSSGSPARCPTVLVPRPHPHPRLRRHTRKKKIPETMQCPTTL